jgi:OOP family OmpA-OmpF porin
VFIVGHAENQGTFDHNVDLWRRRAEAVAAELAKSYKIATARLRTRASASSCPSAPTSPTTAARSTGAWSWSRHKRNGVCGLAPHIAVRAV